MMPSARIVARGRSRMALIGCSIVTASGVPGTADVEASMVAAVAVGQQLQAASQNARLVVGRGAGSPSRRTTQSPSAFRMKK